MVSAVLGGSRLGEVTLGGGPADPAGVARVTDAAVERSGAATTKHLTETAEIHQAATAALKTLTIGQIGATETLLRAIGHRQLGDVIAACEGQLRNEENLATAQQLVDQLSKRAAPTDDLTQSLKVHREAFETAREQIDSRLAPVLHPTALTQASNGTITQVLTEYAATFKEQSPGLANHLRRFHHELNGSVDEATGLIDPEKVRAIATTVSGLMPMRLRDGGSTLFTESHKATLGAILDTLAMSAAETVTQVAVARKVMEAVGVEPPARTLTIPTAEERVGAGQIKVLGPDPYLTQLQEFERTRTTGPDRPFTTTLGNVENLGKCGAADLSIAPIMLGAVQLGTCVSLYLPRIGTTVELRDFDSRYDEYKEVTAERKEALKKVLWSLKETAKFGTAEDVELAISSLSKGPHGHRVAGYTIRPESPIAGFSAELPSKAYGYSYSDKNDALARALKDDYELKLTPLPDNKIIGTDGTLKSVTLRFGRDRAYSAELRFGAGSSDNGRVNVVGNGILRDRSDLISITDRILSPKGETGLDSILEAAVTTNSVKEMRNVTIVKTWKNCTINTTDDAEIDNCSILCGNFELRGTNIAVRNSAIEADSISLTLKDSLLYQATMTADRTLSGSVGSCRIVRSSIASKGTTRIKLPDNGYEGCKRTGVFSHSIALTEKVRSTATAV